MGELEVGDELVLAGGGCARVVSLTAPRGPPADSTELLTTYNIEVGSAHTYFVGQAGVWVHNASAQECERAFNVWTWLTQKRQLDDIAAFAELRRKLPNASDKVLGGVIEEVVRKRNASLQGITELFTPGGLGDSNLNLWRHVTKHLPEFAGRIDSPIEYVERLFALTSRQSSDSRYIVGWKKTGVTWDKVVLDRHTGDFAVKSVQGPTAGSGRTLFRPTNNPEGYIRSQPSFTEVRTQGVVD